MATVRAFQVTFDCADPARVARFWCDVLGYETPDGGDCVAQDPTGVGPRMYFQQVPEGKVVKNRLHLDVRPPDSMDREVERAVALGATIDRRVDVEGSFWTIMFDPEGNEFCILRSEAEMAEQAQS